jgi:hypothetical protein
LLAKTENLAGETGKREASNMGGACIMEGGLKYIYTYSNEYQLIT